MKYKNMALMSLAAGLAVASFGAAQETPQSIAGQACDRLMAQVQDAVGADGASMRCGSDDAHVLILNAGSVELFNKARGLVFPDGSFAGYPVKQAVLSGDATSANAPQSTPANGQPELHRLDGLLQNTAGKDIDFDFAGTRDALNASVAPTAPILRVDFDGPPGSSEEAPAPSNNNQDRPGPPGSGDSYGPPGSNSDRSGPPGSNGDLSGPPGSVPVPPSSAPPSRPAPAFEVTPPAPSWWNTYEHDITIWDNPLSDYGSDTYDQSTLDFTTRWYSAGPVWEGFDHTTDSYQFVRTASNQNDDINRRLVSQTVSVSKYCYYREHGHLEWVEGGFEGSHWEKHFGYYEGACTRIRGDAGSSNADTVVVHFDMRQKSLLPWEQETVNFSYDGASVNYSVSNPSYEYSRIGSSSGNYIRLEARQKLQTRPDPDGVSIYLVNEDGRLKLKWHDKWAKYYDGETFELAYEIVKPGGFFGWGSKDAAVVRQEAPFTIHSPQADGSIDLEVGSGKYWIYSASFRRADSKLSTGDWINFNLNGNGKVSVP